MGSNRRKDAESPSAPGPAIRQDRLHPCRRAVEHSVGFQVDLVVSASASTLVRLSPPCCFLVPANTPVSRRASIEALLSRAGDPDGMRPSTPNQVFVQ